MNPPLNPPRGVASIALAVALMLNAGAATAQNAPSSQRNAWEFGAVLDLAHSSKALALGKREKGLALGHSDVTARGPLGRHLSAQFTVAAHSDDGKIEAEVEEAWVQTRGLPAGLQVRAGRFASQVGALNEQHPHADDFVERPMMYRSMLGGHWFDDGVRVNWTAPTSMYLSIGAEVFSGRQLVKEAVSKPRPGAATLRLKLGDDWGTSHSWQLGASYVHNRREAALEEAHEEHEGEEGAGHATEEHAHAHGAVFSGRRMWMLDMAWKWAPDGNNRLQQVKLLAEVAQISGLNRYATSGDRHRAGALSAVWRFHQDWEVGVRTDWLRARMPHGEHFDPVRLQEQTVMLAWKPTHAQTLRVQFVKQHRGQGIEGVADRAVQLQYVISLGAHGAHAF